jgi:multisubunit Na+/H+ antiporter MnhB subunit
MERIGYVMLEIGAVVVGVVLFALGYTTVKNRFQGRRGRIFWTAVAVVLAFMTVTFSKAEEHAKTEPVLPLTIWDI